MPNPLTTPKRIAVLPDPLGKVPSAIINGYSVSGWFTTTMGAPGSVAALWLKTSLSGVLSAGVLKNVLSITGGGVLHFVGISAVDTTSRTMRVQITLDGASTPQLDSTSAANVVANRGGSPIGMIDSSGTMFPTVSVPFEKSCNISIASSVGETDKCNIFLAYQVN